MGPNRAIEGADALLSNENTNNRALDSLHVTKTRRHRFLLSYGSCTDRCAEVRQLKADHQSLLNQRKMVDNKQRYIKWAYLVRHITEVMFCFPTLQRDRHLCGSAPLWPLGAAQPRRTGADVDRIDAGNLLTRAAIVRLCRYRVLQWPCTVERYKVCKTWTWTKGAELTRACEGGWQEIYL